MKTGENQEQWENNILLPDECLPIIGSYQTSSVLQHSDTIEVSQNGKNDYVVLKENGAQEKAKTNKKIDSNNFKDMLYFVCNLCPFLCTNNAKITEHLENAHKNKIVRNLPQLKCPACMNIFFHKLPLKSHLIHDHGVGNSDLNQIVEAVVYYATNKHKEAQKKAVKKESDTKQVEGQESEVRLESQPENAETGKAVDLKRVHRCTFPGCKVHFQDTSNINLHIASHKGNGFECTVCQEQFTLWKQLASHLWRSHKVDMELHPCDQCDYKSISLYKLNNIHKLIHSDAKNFSCSVCDKAFKNVKQLSNHKNTHKTQDKTRILCKVCLKQFSDKRQLKIHMDVVHEKIKPFLCNYCGYKGSSRSSLKMHIRQHTGEKPFSCDSCPYVTSDHNSLRRHKLRHTGQKPYKCSYCTYACIQSSTYKVHLKTKHPGLEKDLMFTCKECQFRTVNKEIYMAHLITAHKLKPNDIA